MDDHHIFARAYLDKLEKPAALRDCILNRTFIDRTTNRRLSKRAPSEYIGEIRDKHGTSETDELLRSHVLPEGNDSPLLCDDFERFLDCREAALKELIQKRTGI